MLEVIDKWKLNRNLLASKMEMPKGTFNNKLSANHPTKFTQEELQKLKCILVELRNDLESVDDIDFNDALALISRKQV